MTDICKICGGEFQVAVEVPGTCDDCTLELLGGEEDHTELWTRAPDEHPVAVRPFSVNKRGEVTQLHIEELAYLLGLAGYTKVQDVAPLQAEWISPDGARHQ